MGDAIRTVVLARDGEARERVVEGLAQAGAELVATLDPGQHTPDALDALTPSVLVVVLDPADEDALERFESAFATPGLTVIFEEAALVLERTGWDAARWVRHLAAKLRRQGDVLPPSVAGDAGDATDAGPLTLEFDAHADAGASVASDAPVIEETETPHAHAPAPASDDTTHLAFDPVAAEFEAPSTDASDVTDAGPLTLEFDAPADAGGFIASNAPVAGQAETPHAPVPDSDDKTHLAFDPVAAEFEVPSATQAPVVEFSFDFELADYDETSYTPPATPPGEVRDLNENLADWSDAPASDTVQSSTAVAAEASAEVSRDVPSPASAQPASEPLTLLDDGDALPSFRAAVTASDDAPDVAAPATTVQRDLSDLESRISGLSLADEDSYGHGPAKGVVLIVGGLGGPDAVRQLLGALPEGFPRPILVRLQLDGGRYDRLVRQMERATAMPVQLAEAGMSVSPGEVYFLPPELLPGASGGELRFTESTDLAGLADAVPADDSAVLLLSGADPALVDIAMGPAWQGALVGGQTEDGCYDPIAAQRVAQRGGPSGTPIDIADWLIARWMPSARRFESGELSL